MEPDIAIRAEGLGKSYPLAAVEPYVALRDVIAERVRGLGRRLRGTARAPSRETFWALREASFDVRRGEVLGVIGRNGAGKSTLLKLLSRITEPTEGRARIAGRVASMLEVGTGFHPELTGRENVYLNGAILGMTRAEVRRKFDEIVAFAEVERFLDTPVKRYSSGMHLRLAFAVAAHLEPEILVIDEVLAVGDVEFQNRCFGKMRSVAAGEGRTVLLVSHSMATVQALCSRALYLDQGRVAAQGPAAEVVGAYLRDLALGQAAVRGLHRRLGGALSLQRLALSPSPVEAGRPLGFDLELESDVMTSVKEVAVLLYSSYGVRVAILDLRDPAGAYPIGPGRPLRLRGDVERLPLVEGDYSVGLYVNAGDVHDQFLDLVPLAVSPAPAGALAPYSAYDRGVVSLDVRFSRDATAREVPA